MFINQNIRFLREKEGWTQKDFADKLDIKTSQFGAYEELRAIPPLSIIIKISDLFQTDIDTLVRTDLASKRAKKEKFIRGADVLAISVDNNGRENVEMVTQKASAGYLAGYHDVEYVKDLPKVHLPMLPSSSTYRCFEIKGESMLPIMPKSFVIGAFVDNLDKITDGTTCIIISKTEGIVYKRVFKFLADEKLLLVSDNPEFKPYLIDVREVVQVWIFKGYFSFDAPEVELPKRISLQHLALRVVENL